MKTVNEFLEQYKDYTIKDEEALLKLLEKPMPKTVWDLQKGDTYWFVDSAGEIVKATWGNYCIDNALRDNRRCYLTEKDAEFAREQEKIIAEMERLGGTMDMMSLGDNYTFKYCLRFIRYSNNRGSKGVLRIDKYYQTNYTSNIYFATYKQAQKAIDTIGEDRLKKYLFYVED